MSRIERPGTILLETGPSRTLESGPDAIGVGDGKRLLGTQCLGPAGIESHD